MSPSTTEGGVDRRGFLKAAGAGAVSATTAGVAAGDTSTDEENVAHRAQNDTDELVNIANQVIGTIDPAKHTDYTEIAAVLNFYDPMIMVDPDSFKPTKFIGTEWKTENNGKTWVFTLREDVPFQRGGTLTADDVAYSMKRMLSIGLGYSSLWQGVLDPKDVEVRDDRTVAFTTKSTYGPFLATLVQLFIVDSATVKKNEKSGEFGERGDYGQQFLKNNIAGSGPYTLGNWKTGSEMVFEMFDDYWQGWEPNQFERARMRIVKEESTVRLLMKQGKADMTSQFLSTESYQAMRDFQNVKVPEVSQLQLFHLPLHCQKAPTDDIHVRKAIAHAFDYDTAIKDIVQGGKQAAGSVPREMPGHNDEIQPYKQDLEKAKAELQKAEYSVQEINEIGLEQVHVANFPLERKMATLLAANLRKIGITNVEINPQQWATITKRAANKEQTPHITHIFHTAKFPSPDSHTYLMYHPSSFGTYISMSWFTTDELKSTLEAARRETNLEKRLAKYKEAQTYINEGYPSVFVANPPYRIGLNKNLGGWSYRGLLSFDLRWNTMFRKGEGRAK